MLNIARHWLFIRYALSNTTWMLPKDNMLSSQTLISDGSKKYLLFLYWINTSI